MLGRGKKTPHANNNSDRARSAVSVAAEKGLLGNVTSHPSQTCSGSLPNRLHDTERSGGEATTAVVAEPEPAVRLGDCLEGSLFLGRVEGRTDISSQPWAR